MEDDGAEKDEDEDEDEDDNVAEDEVVHDKVEEGRKPKSISGCKLAGQERP